MSEDRAEYKVVEGAGKTLPRFSEFLDMVSGGRSDLDLADELMKLMQAVRDSGAKGSLTYKVHLAPDGDVGFIVVEEINAKTPKRPRGKNILYQRPDGWVSDQHPKQMRLQGI